MTGSDRARGRHLRHDGGRRDPEKGVAPGGGDAHPLSSEREAAISEELEAIMASLSSDVAMDSPFRPQRETPELSTVAQEQASRRPDSPEGESVVLSSSAEKLYEVILADLFGGSSAHTLSSHQTDMPVSTVDVPGDAASRSDAGDGSAVVLSARSEELLEIIMTKLWDDIAAEQLAERARRPRLASPSEERGGPDQAEDEGNADARALGGVADTPVPEEGEPQAVSAGAHAVATEANQEVSPDTEGGATAGTPESRAIQDGSQDVAEDADVILAPDEDAGAGEGSDSADDETPTVGPSPSSDQVDDAAPKSDETPVKRRGRWMTVVVVFVIVVGLCLAAWYATTSGLVPDWSAASTVGGDPAWRSNAPSTPVGGQEGASGEGQGVELASSRCAYEMSDPILTQAERTARALDGVRIESADTLSLLERVGGSEDTGTQVVASALYVASLESGLGIRERHAADEVVPWAPAGLEAAVGNEAGDLVIANDTMAPVLLTTSVDQHGVTVAVFGDHDDDLSYKVSTRIVDSVANDREGSRDVGKTGTGITRDDNGYLVVESRVETYRNGRVDGGEILSLDTYRVSED